jgi:hypothetical protein
MVLVTSFFLYDVEITFVKYSPQQGVPPELIRRHSDVWGSRVLWRDGTDIDDDDNVRVLIPSPPTSDKTTRTLTTRRGFQESLV